MDAVTRAQERAEADFVSALYGLLDSQSRLVLAMLRKQTDRPLTDPLAQKLLASIVAQWVLPTGTFHIAWIDVLGALYLGLVSTSVKLLGDSLPDFSLSHAAAVAATRAAIETRSISQAGYITSTLAADFAGMVNRTANIAVPGAVTATAGETLTLGSVVTALQGGTFAPNALDGRAQRIAATEAPGWLNESRDALVHADGTYTRNTWRTERDDSVRLSHALQEGMQLPVGTVFPNGCRYPGDYRADVSEIVNCRCWLDYS